MGYVGTISVLTGLDYLRWIWRAEINLPKCQQHILYDLNVRETKRFLGLHFGYWQNERIVQKCKCLRQHYSLDD